MPNAPLLAFLGIPPGPIMGIALAIIVLWLLVWGIKQPLAWTVVSFIAIGNGIGCAAYGCARALLAEGPQTKQEVEWISIFIGGGFGGTVAGTLLLIAAVLRCKKSAEMKH